MKQACGRQAQGSEVCGLRMVATHFMLHHDIAAHNTPAMLKRTRALFVTAMESRLAAHAVVEQVLKALTERVICVLKWRGPWDDMCGESFDWCAASFYVFLRSDNRPGAAKHSRVELERRKLRHLRSSSLCCCHVFV